MFNTTINSVFNDDNAKEVLSELYIFSTSMIHFGIFTSHMQYVNAMFIMFDTDKRVCRTKSIPKDLDVTRDSPKHGPACSPNLNVA